MAIADVLGSWLMDRAMFECARWNDLRRLPVISGRRQQYLRVQNAARL